MRQAVKRIERAGYTSRVRRHGEIPDDEMAELLARAQAWRGAETERGFSMALGRLGDPSDGRSVMVEAYDARGDLRGLLSFVPWGRRGLSLDLMRRDRDAENGLNEYMIAEVVAAGPHLGAQRISLNFAMFRAVFSEGERIGAGPVLRAWRGDPQRRVAVLPAGVAVPVQRQVRAGVGAAVPLLLLGAAAAARRHRRGRARRVRPDRTVAVAAAGDGRRRVRRARPGDRGVRGGPGGEAGRGGRNRSASGWRSWPSCAKPGSTRTRSGSAATTRSATSSGSSAACSPAAPPATASGSPGACWRCARSAGCASRASRTSAARSS